MSPRHYAFYPFTKEPHRLIGRLGLLCDTELRRIYEHVMGLPENAPLHEEAGLAIRAKDSLLCAR